LSFARQVTVVLAIAATACVVSAASAPKGAAAPPGKAHPPKVLWKEFPLVPRPTGASSSIPQTGQASSAGPVRTSTRNPAVIAFLTLVIVVSGLIAFVGVPTRDGRAVVRQRLRNAGQWARRGDGGSSGATDTQAAAPEEESGDLVETLLSTVRLKHRVRR
jgi:hypothetical protein